MLAGLSPGDPSVGNALALLACTLPAGRLSRMVRLFFASPAMLRTTSLLLLLAAAARADDPAKKITYPQDQQGTVDRLEKIKSLRQAANNPRNAAVLREALD